MMAEAAPGGHGRGWLVRLAVVLVLTGLCCSGCILAAREAIKGVDGSSTSFGSTTKAGATPASGPASD